MSRRTANQKDLRNASHAGDWYTSDARTLDTELSTWLSAVGPTEEPYPIQGCKAIIAPSALDNIKEALAAWAYKSIDTTGIKRVFILGPSHHLYLEGCALSACKEYATPIGKLPLDVETINELKATGKFDTLMARDDEAEHSIEMHLPYVRKIFEGKDINIVPIVVGSMTQQVEASYGNVLASYLSRKDTFCVVSSDFCHWGTRFSYTYYYPEAGPTSAPAVRLSRAVAPSPDHPIHKSISKLDHEAMALLTLPPSKATEAHANFAKYLAQTKNTICGRHPIGVLLGAMSALEALDQTSASTIKWVRYEQSSQCISVGDSSVSYASAWVKF